MREEDSVPETFFQKIRSIRKIRGALLFCIRLELRNAFAVEDEITMRSPFGQSLAHHPRGRTRSAPPCKTFIGQFSLQSYSRDFDWRRHYPRAWLTWGDDASFERFIETTAQCAQAPLPCFGCF